MDLEYPLRLPPSSPDYTAITDPERLEVVASTGLLGRVRDPALDDIVEGLTTEGAAPICAVIVVDAYRQLFASSAGLPEPWRALREAPLARSRSQLVVASRQPLIIDDAETAPPVSVPMAMVDRGIRAWLGLPLVGTGCQVVGVLALMDEQPRQWLPGALKLAHEGVARANAAIERRIARRAAAQSRPAR